MKEVFKDIAGYKGKYQVSNLGHVKSLNYNGTGKEKILKHTETNDGYYRIHLSKNGKVKSYYLHRLVGQAFLENPDNLPEINHKNELKSDNRVSNLEWCTRRYNNTYNNLHLRNAKTIGCYKDGKLIKVYVSIQAVKIDGFNDGNVCSVLKGRYKSSGGYQWKYID